MRLQVAVAGALLLLVSTAPALAATTRSRPGAGSAPPLRLLVIPPVNATGDRTLDWLAVGLQDALSSDLMSLPGIRPLFLGEVPELATAPIVDPARFPEKLRRLDQVWVGRYSGDRRLLTVWLAAVEPASGRRVAELTLRAPLADLLSVSSLGVLDLAGQLGWGLAEGERQRILQRKTGDLGAWEQNAIGYLRQQLYAVAPAAERAGLLRDWQEALRRAVAADSGYAEAWNNLGWSYVEAGDNGEAIAAFSAAVQRKPELVDAQLGLGAALSLAEDFEGSGAGFLRALSVNPDAIGDPGLEELFFDCIARRHKFTYRDLQISRGVRAEAEPRAVTLEAIKDVSALSGRSAALICDYASGIFSVWLINSQGIMAARHIGIAREEIAASIARYRETLVSWRDVASRAPIRLSAGPPAPTTPLRPELASPALVDLLFPEPVRQSLAGVDRLVVVPVLAVGTVPFAALRLPDRDGRETYLVEHMSVTVASHLGNLLEASRDGIQGFSPVERALVVGNPVVEADVEFHFPALTGAEQEAKSVAAHFASQLLLRDAATKSRVMANDLLGVDLIYFATHGIADEQNPLDGGFLALTPGSGSDGRLTAREIQALKLPWRPLVVLSACQTGLGQTHEAGIIGLARAFSLAGARQVVMSLWNVSDEATRELMDGFVAALATLPPPEALRQAMLGVRGKYARPSDWASFQVFGYQPDKEP